MTSLEHQSTWGWIVDIIHAKSCFQFYLNKTASSAQLLSKQCEEEAMETLSIRHRPFSRFLVLSTNNFSGIRCFLWLFSSVVSITVYAAFHAFCLSLSQSILSLTKPETLSKKTSPAWLSFLMIKPTLILATLELPQQNLRVQLFEKCDAFHQLLLVPRCHSPSTRKECDEPLPAAR